MPMYTWCCETCDADTEVKRSFDDIDLGPDNGCHVCGSSDKLRRVIRLARSKGVKGFILEGTGWHDTEYTKNRSRR